MKADEEHPHRYRIELNEDTWNKLMAYIKDKPVNVFYMNSMHLEGGVVGSYLKVPIHIAMMSCYPSDATTVALAIPNIKISNW